MIGCSIEINLDSKIQIKYIDTKNQLADILTKGNFTRDEWNHLLNLLNIIHFSSAACTAAMAKRAQQESGEERVTAKSRLMMNLTSRMPSIVSSSTSSMLGKTWHGYQDPEKSVAVDDRSGKPEKTSWDILQKLLLIVKNLFSAEMRIPQGTERRFPMDRGNLRQWITKKRQIPKISSWAVTQQNV